MFLLLLIGLAVAAAIHASRLEERTPRRVAEIGLVWLLVGYCGVPMVAVAIGVLVFPERAAEILGHPAGNPFQSFLGFAYLGMALAATLAARYRRDYLIGPSVAWAVFFAGATWVHVADSGGLAAMGPHALLHVFASHALVSILLIGALVGTRR